MAKTTRKMSNETQLIMNMLNNQNEERKNQIIEHAAKNDLQFKGLQISMNAGFDTIAKELQEIKTAKKEQNGRVDKLEKLTSVQKFIYEHPKKSLLIILISWFGIPKIISLIPFAELLKKLF